MNSEQFLIWIGENYTYQKEKLQKWCAHNKYKFEEDIFSDTIVKVHDYIEKHGLRDGTPTGVDSYFFISFKNNLKRELQYSRNKNKIELPELNKKYEDYYNEHYDSATVKIMKDLQEDFSTLYVLRLVEDNFCAEDVYVFKMKFLYNLTYKELAQRTKVKNSRQKIINIIHWLKANLSKEDLEKFFDEFKGNIL